MSAQHTPGPWTVTLAAGGIGRPQIVRVVASRVETVVVQRGGSVYPADARLIAAAPDLLAAIKALVGNDLVRDVDDVGPLGDRYQSPAITDLFAAADAAIAKAEGR